MEQFKRVEVIMLPSKNPQVSYGGDIYLAHHDITSYPLRIANGKPNSPTSYRKECVKQHLYIISNDEIKKGDWFIYDNKIYKSILTNGECITIEGGYGLSFLKTECKKIISTTNKLPLNDCTTPWTLEHKYIPQPSQQFIEKYIECYNKGEIITDILVEYDKYIERFGGRIRYGKSTYHPYIKEINKLKINPKDNSINICFMD